MDDPTVADATVFHPWTVACPREGRPVRVPFPSWHWQPVGGLPGGVPGPPGLSNVKLQPFAKPKSAGFKITRFSSVCKRDLRVLAWEVARRSPRVMKVAFIILIYFKIGN